jgi:hypothetical protein
MTLKESEDYPVPWLRRGWERKKRGEPGLGNQIEPKRKGISDASPDSRCKLLNNCRKKIIDNETKKNPRYPRKSASNSSSNSDAG